MLLCPPISRSFSIATGLRSSHIGESFYSSIVKIHLPMCVLAITFELYHYWHFLKYCHQFFFLWQTRRDATELLTQSLMRSCLLLQRVTGQQDQELLCFVSSLHLLISFNMVHHIIQLPHKSDGCLILLPSMNVWCHLFGHIFCWIQDMGPAEFWSLSRLSM